MIQDYVNVEIKEELIYNFITHGKEEQPFNALSLPNHLDVDLTIIGSGGVGQAIVFALNQIKLRGRINLIDPDFIDVSNKQRYLFAFNETIR